MPVENRFTVIGKYNSTFFVENVTSKVDLLLHLETYCEKVLMLLTFIPQCHYSHRCNIHHTVSSVKGKIVFIVSN